LNTVFLNDYYTELGAKFVPFAGYSMPINFSSGIIKEHQHTRMKSGLFDVSHMGQMLIPNDKDNFNKLETVIPQNLIQLPMSQSVYSFILNSDGGIVDDCIISKLIIDSIEYLFVVYNASRKKIDEKIINNLVSNQITLKNNSLIALQGPYSSKIINSVFPQASELNFMQIESFIFNSENIIVSRSGYTGEDGFELSVPNTQIKNIVEKFSNHNDIIFCGLGCRDSLRLEAGLCLYGNELNETISPIEANLKWAISKTRLREGGFAGYDRIINELRSGTSRSRIGIISINKSILRSKMSLHNNDGIKVGEITSGGYSPSLNLSIAMAYINKDHLKLSNEIYCSIRGNMNLINISKLPFIKLNYKRSK
jgi:aminomethyltransferase